jgi:hypothetical protein
LSNVKVTNFVNLQNFEFSLKAFELDVPALETLNLIWEKTYKKTTKNYRKETFLGNKKKITRKVK